MSKSIIKVEDVYKEYRLGAIGGTTLRDDLARLGAKIMHKEDPTLKIGEENKGKHNERFLALRGVSFEVKEGEALGIIGHNGAGKSTLLKLLSRVTAPSKGRILMNGRVTSMLEVGTGFHPELTGRENIYLNGAILGMTKAEITRKFDEIVEFSEVAKFIDTPVKRYSSGMFVKLAFSVASHLDSEIMIMDEVLAVGDMKFQEKCINKMREVANKDGRTILYVSHNMNTIKQLCDRCIVLNKGQIEYSGDVAPSIERYLGFGGEDGIDAYTVDKQDRYDGLSEDIHISYCEYLKSEDFISQSKMIMKVKWKNNGLKSDDKFFFRVEFSALGQGIATYCSNILCDPTKEEATIEIDVSGLVPATYNLVLVAYQTASGASVDMDIVSPPPFRKESTEQKLSHWNPNYWGYMELKGEISQ